MAWSEIGMDRSGSTGPMPQYSTIGVTEQPMTWTENVQSQLSQIGTSIDGCLSSLNRIGDKAYGARPEPPDSAKLNTVQSGLTGEVNMRLSMLMSRMAAMEQAIQRIENLV